MGSDFNDDLADPHAMYLPDHIIYEYPFRTYIFIAPNQPMTFNL